MSKKPLTSEFGERVFLFEKIAKERGVNFTSLPGYIYILSDYEKVIVLTQEIRPKEYRVITGWINSGCSLEILDTHDKIRKCFDKMWTKKSTDS